MPLFGKTARPQFLHMRSDNGMPDWEKTFCFALNVHKDRGPYGVVIVDDSRCLRSQKDQED